MKKIELHTTLTPITIDGIIKPTAPIWRIENIGSAGLYVDNFFLNPGNNFGIDATPVVAKLLAKNIFVESDTQFKITFKNDLPSYYLREAVLIQTFVKVIS